MDFAQFIDSLQFDQPDQSLPPLLQALWYDSKGDWNSAHNIADGFGTPDGDWVHAYLHRKEGDSWNAGYWYRKAHKSFPDVDLETERKLIIQALLDKN